MEAVPTCVSSGVGSMAISSLVNRAFAMFDELGKKSKDMEAAKGKLDKAMVPVQTVLTAVDQGQIKVPEKALDDWIWHFRNAVEEAEDTIDEIDYYKREEKVQARDKAAVSGGDTVSMMEKVKRFVPKPKNTDRLLKKLKEALKGLEKVSLSVEPFLLLANTLNTRGKNQEQSSRFRETGSLLTESVVIGREKEKDEIIQWLENSGEYTDKKIPAFSVVGMGGMGKTTLARLICHEIEEKKVLNLNPVVWVSVSDNFGALDAKVILRKILEDITKSSCNIQNLSTLQEMLKEKVLTKKFVLVLDDIWRDDPSSCNQWAQILAPLKFGRKGSKIIVTTRTESVADMMTKLVEGSKESDQMRLTGLDNDSTLKLLNRFAFADVPDPDEHLNLQSISKEIASKLGGCPLAAKVMGLLLNDHIDFDYWERIWKQDISNLPSGEKGIMAVLRLSYHHLPADLQLCFRYCSIFPHQHKFIKDDLVKMLMGSGLIQWSKQSRRPEDIGGDFFDHLIRKSFFDVSRDSEHCFIMHDLMHEMVISISSRECLRVEGVISKESIPETTRHLFIKIKGLSSIKEISHLKHLRSLVVTFDGEQPESKDILELNEVVKELKSLRLLSITGANLFELPNHVGDLIHLRYISLKQMAKKTLQWCPKPINKLYHLEVLIIFAFSIGQLSDKDLSGMGNFVNLRYLDIHYSILYKFPRIGKLISLQKLEFNIWEEDGYKISELKEVKDAQELNIKNLDKVKSPEEAEEAKINEKQSLNALSFYWSEDCSNCELILDTLRPHPHLQKLDITAYCGSRSPVWLQNGYLSNLVSLRLYTCRNWESLPPLGKLISLRILWLYNFPEVKQIGPSFYGCSDGSSFQSLRELRISSMPQWSEWVDLEGITLFPRLEIVELEDCPELRTLPTMPFSLKLLSFRFCGLHTLPRMQCSTKTNNLLEAKPALSILRISHCPDIITLESGPLLQQDLFQAFQEITIESCQKLETLPSKGFSGLLSLKKLRIDGCPNLVTNKIRDDILPISLGELWIEKCGLEESLLCSLRDLTSLIRIDLTGCSNIKSLPSEEVFIKLSSLRDLRIMDCNKLSSLGGLGALVELTYLRITRCDELAAVSLQPTIETGFYQGDVARTNLKIGELYISPSSLLQIEPLRSLRFTKKIGISWESLPELLPEQWMLQNSTDLEEIEIDNAGALQFVPPTMVRLSCLIKLTLSRANLIDSLPELPFSLRVLVVTGCNEVFNERYRKDSGSNWQEIEDIPQVVICN